MSEPSITLSNVELIDAQYAKWRRDPGSVGREWSAFFEGFELGSVHAEQRESVEVGADGAKRLEGGGVPADSGESGVGADGTSGRGESADGGAEPSSGPSDLPVYDGDMQRQVDMLIYAYRDLGHTQAKLDPLQQVVVDQPLLSLEKFGFTEDDLDQKVSSSYYLRGRELTLRELIDSLSADYASTLGVEFMYIQDPAIRHWMRDRIESRGNSSLTAEVRTRIFQTLLEAETFEHFLHTKYVGQKRFSLEGAESLMVILDTIFQRCPQNGVEEIVMGMAHRGRLNVLANFLDKSPQVIFNEFSENYFPEMVGGDGDVKYHLGYECVRETLDGENVEIRLAANPSHLEAVDPVVQGKTRARQRIREDSANRKKVLPLLVHGDAAFAGQGVVAEVLNMSQLPGYRTGGTVHVIVNNQIGFTTMPADARSTRYATDVAKMIEAPILHVNGDDPLAVAFAAEVAFDFRQKFGHDIVIDMYCYRRHGHNEGDEPAFTQPKLYKSIGEHPSVSRIFRKQLIDEGVLSQEKVDELEGEFRSNLDAALDMVKKSENGGDGEERFKFHESNAIFQPPYSHDPVETAIDRGTLETVVKALTTTPEGFQVVPKVQRILLDRRRKTFDEGGGYDWAYGEALAFGSLLLEGTPVRLSGQDSRRGTFSQRHSVLYDEGTRERYFPLKHISDDQAMFCVYNSLLSEAAVLGFDYGYSLDYPSMLCIWEAQFGDFANGAQVVIDQFITSAENKWQRPSGIVMLLPHGYEGQGPEHSSARLERFLQACADENIQVCNPTTPAQYFHLLRRQMKRPFRKPLVVMTPKSLLRSPDATSVEGDFTSGRFQEMLDVGNGDPGEVRRLVFCSGKVYYDLEKFRKENERRDAALVRIEQIYPFHEGMLERIASKYPKAERCIWCQEEPQNMGAWTHVGLTLSLLLDREVCYAGRDASASPAGGSLAMHRRRQSKLIEEAFTI